MANMHKSTHKRSFNSSQTGSDFSCSSYSSSSTLANNDWFLTPPAPSNKPWALQALNQLSVKYKKSMTFGKGKRKDKRESELDEELYISPYDSKAVPFVLDISGEAVARTKSRLEHENETLDLLPDYPTQVLKKTTSTNVLSQLHSEQRPLRSALRSGSTPNLKLRVKRDSMEDPFHLEKLLGEFPDPPALPGKVVRSPEEYTFREPVKQGLRRNGSDASFSMPTYKAYPGASQRTRKQSKNWLERPVPRDIAIYGNAPSFTRKPLGHCQDMGLHLHSHFPRH